MAEKTPPVRLMTVLAVLSTRLCALADEHVPEVAELLLAIPHLPGNWTGCGQMGCVPPIAS